MSRRLFRREIVVAASLVGAVVVVVGYASGFGVRPIFGAQPPSGGTAAPRAPGATATTPPSTTAPATPAGHPVPRAVVPGVSLPGITSTPPTVVPVYPNPTHPSTPTTPTTPGTPPTTPPVCEPGLVPGALETLLATLGRATDAVGLPLGTLPLTALPLSALPLTTTSTSALPVDPAVPIDDLLGACPK